MIKKIKLLVLFALACNLFYAKAQDDTLYAKLIPIEGLKYKKTIISFAANADIELLKPASLNFGGEFGTYVRLFSKAKKMKNKSIYDYRVADRDLFIKPTIGFIHRERYHTGIYFIPSIVYRHTTPKIVYTEISVDVGYYYAKLNAPTYVQQTNGSFKKVNAGFSKAILGSKLLVGLDFSKSLNVPINLFGGFGLYYTYPNNQNWTRHIIVQMGMAIIIRKNIE